MSAESQPLLEFIEAAKSQGASDDFVVELLRQNGWSEKRIYQAFGSWYEARTGRPVPSGGGRIEAAKDAFLYLLAFITLGIWAIQLGGLFFKTIDRAYPNLAIDSDAAAWVTRSMADELAGIMVAFPLFLLVSRGIARSIAHQPERLESSVRKWLTYIALVLTASIMIGDVVTFLAYFLRGDLSARFVWKVITIFVIASGVFFYYLDSLHREKASPARNRAFAVAATLIVAFGLIAGFMHVGSPTGQRIAAEDARRLHDLSLLAQGVHARWQSRGQHTFVLPATQAELPVAGSPSDSRRADPTSGRTYGYMPLDGTKFRLCATFSRPSPADAPTQWRHPAGEFCFNLDAADDVAFVPRSW